MTRISRISTLILAAVPMFLFAVIGVSSPPEPVNATSTWYANSSTGNDETGDGSIASPFRTFHKAYTAASSGDTINLTGVFTWTDTAESGDTTSGYTLSKSLTIEGQSRETIVQATSIEGAADRGVFYVAAGATVTFSKLTIRYGRVTTSGRGGGITLHGVYCGQTGSCAGTYGSAVLDHVDVVNNQANTNNYNMAGGIYLQENSSLTVTDSNIMSNDCTCSYYGAGGIAGGEQSQRVTIARSSVSQNTASGGSSFAYSYANVAGGMALQRFGTLTVSDSTFVGNTTTTYGGAMLVHYNTRPTLTGVTIAGNTATLGAGGVLVTGYDYTFTKFHIKNSIIADNTSAGTLDLHETLESGGSIVNLTYSIVESSNKAFAGTGLITGNQASLNLASALSTNGAHNGTYTLALNEGSVAIDAGDAAAHGVTGYTVTPSSFDQRNASRSSPYDVGAFEYGGVALPTLRYNSNGGGGVTPSSSSLDSGASTTVASGSGLSRAGYSFSGWNTASDGSGTSYSGGASYTMGSDDVTLYAQWTANTLTITYDSQGGSTISDGDTTTTTGATISAVPTDPTRTGYTFTGWYTAASNGTQITTSSPHGQTASFTLYAQWTANPSDSTSSTSSTVVTTTTIATSSTTSTTVRPSTGSASAIGTNGEQLDSDANAVFDADKMTLQIRNSDGTSLEVEQQQSSVAVSVVFERESPMTLTGDGYPPGANINVWLNSVRTLVGRSVADSRGAFEIELSVPANFDLGAHTLEVVASTSAGNHTTFVGVEITTSERELPTTGDSTTGHSAYLVLATALGFILLLLRRRVI